MLLLPNSGGLALHVEAMFHCTGPEQQTQVANAQQKWASAATALPPKASSVQVHSSTTQIEGDDTVVETHTVLQLQY